MSEKLTLGFEEDTESKYPIRFVNKCDKRICMFCEHKSEKSIYKQVKIGDFFGWIYCDTCLEKGYPREAVLNHIKKKQIIPCAWIFSSQSFRRPSFYSTMRIEKENDIDYDIVKVEDDMSKNRRHLHFYLEKSFNKEEPIQTATFVSWQTDDLILMNINSSTDAYMLMEYKSQKKNGIFGYSRDSGPLLENILYHNPTFYKELISCHNILNDKYIKLFFSDLSEPIKDVVHKANDTVSAYEGEKTKEKLSHNIFKCKQF